jgi:hypothetical protein
MQRSSKRRRLRAPSPAMVVACIALAIALSGAGYAAVKLPANSVGAKQLKKNAVTSIKVKASAINGAKVANNSLTGDDINESTLQGVNAATLGGKSASDFAANESGQSRSYMVSGAAWVDANSTGRNLIVLTRTAAAPNPSVTEACTQPGAAAQPGGSQSGNGFAAAFQSIHLPQGAAITGMVVDYGDDPTVTTANGTLTLTRIPIFSSDGTTGDILIGTLADRTPAGSPAVVTDGLPPFNHPEFAIVDNTKYSYVLQAFPTVPATTTLAAASGTTLQQDVAAGAVGIRVNSLANMVVGSTIRIDNGAAGEEVRTIAAVDSLAVSPDPNVLLTTALSNAHTTGAGVQPSAVRVTSTTGLVAGQTITIDTGANAEVRTIGTVIAGPPASPNANITLAGFSGGPASLTLAHANGVNVYVPAAAGTPAPLAQVAYCNVRVDYELP